MCRLYREQGRGYFEKVEPPTRTMGFGTNRRVIYLENPLLDFLGVWTEHRQMNLHFEVKSTMEPRLPCGGDSGFSATQLTAMRLWREFGAGAFLLWEYNHEVRLFFLAMIEAGISERKSLVFEDGLPVPPGKGFMFFDFLTLIKQHTDYL